MGNHPSTYEPSNGFTRWLDERLPILRMMSDQFGTFPTPKNNNFLWTFGGILMFCLAIQLITGIVLAMHYVPHGDMAFQSVEIGIMRDMNWGWLMRYTHAVGSSMFFFAVFVHMFRGLYYGSYKAPRELLWIFGVVIFFLMVVTAFMGYSLPWGQMSYWAVTVITNLMSSLNSIWSGLGDGIVQWIWGGYSVGSPTLNRLFSLHYLFPFLICAVVGLHVWALHVTGSNNPTGVEVKTADDTVSFHPYYSYKDGLAVIFFGILYAWFIFYAPNYLGHADNFNAANPMQTPAHIVPEWYFLPFYAILRAIPSKLFGVIAMVAAILVLFVVPWLDRSKIRSVRYRPMFKPFFWFFLFTCLALGYFGGQNPDRVFGSIGSFELTTAVLSRFFTFYYFAFFLIIMPFVPLWEKPKQLPESIDASVKG